jgi:hypothetical protein
MAIKARLDVGLTGFGRRKGGEREEEKATPAEGSI